MQNINYIETISILLTTAATIFAALAAFLSYLVSKNSLKFQKSYSKNQCLIYRINLVISKIKTLRILISNPLSVSDDKFISIQPIFLEMKSELESLKELNALKYSSLKLSKIISLEELMEHISDNHSFLFDVINDLEKKINDMFL